MDEMHIWLRIYLVIKIIPYTINFDSLITLLICISRDFFSLSVTDSCKVTEKKVEYIDRDAGILASKFHVIIKACEWSYPFVSVFSMKTEARSKLRVRRVEED